MWPFHSRKSRRRPPAYRARLEALEDRCLLSAGDLDPTFNPAGNPPGTATNSAQWIAWDVLVQPSGKLVVAGGSVDANGDPVMSVSCFNPDGTLDTTFGSGGTAIPSNSNASVDVYLPFISTLYPTGGTGDDKILEGGSDALVRLNADGSLDTSFGNGGVLLQNSFAMAGAVVEPDGKIIVAGDNGTGFALARYNPDGSLDTTFGSGGTVYTPIGNSTNAVANCLAQEPNGDLIVDGEYGGSPGPNPCVLAAYSPNGTLDQSFGTNGLVYNSAFTSARGPHIYPATDTTGNAGKIVVALGGHNSAVIARYNPDGTLDTSFGSGGMVTLSDRLGTAVAIQSDGKVVAAGAVGNPSSFGLARYNPDGSLDSTFGKGGIVTAGWGDWDYGVALQPNGAIVACGGAGGLIVGVARFLGSGLATPATPSISGFPSPATAGVAGTFTVTAQNPDGTTDTGYTGTVHFTSGDPQAALPADYTFTPADHGIHTFSATLVTAGSQSLTAADTATSLSSVEQVTVVPAAPDHLTFAQEPTGTTAGQAINAGTAPAGVRVALFDKFDNPETQDSGDAVTVTVHSGPSNSLLGTLTETASGGVAVFPDLSLDMAGSYTLEATSPTQPGVSALVSAGFVISPAAPDHLAFTQSPTDTTAGLLIDGGSVPAGVRVGVFDRFNNPETGDNGDTITLAIHSGPSSSLLGTTTQTASGGVAVFGDLAIDAAGSYTVQATSPTQPGLAAVLSPSFAITAAAPDHLTFLQQPTGTTAGQAINAGTAPAGVRVGLFDKFNNPEAGDSSDAVTVAVQSGPSNTLLGTLTETASGGVAVFADLSLDIAGSYTLQATSPTQSALAATVSASFVIGPGAPDHLAFTQQPTGTTAGQTINAGTVPAGVRVGVFDKFNNPEPQDSSDAVTVAVGSGPSGSLLGTLTQTASGGVAAFPDLSLDAAGTYTLQATSTAQPALAADVSASFVISPATPDHLGFVQPPTDTAAGQPIDGGSVPAGVRVGVFDRFNNPETGDNGDTITFAIHSGPSARLQGTTTQTVSGGVAVFGDLAINTAGSYTLQATSPTQPRLAAVISPSFAITAAAPDHLAFLQQPTDTIAGQAIDAGTAPAGVRVGLFDKFNNPEAGDSADAVTLAVGSGPSNSLLGTLTEAASGGVAVFADLSLDVAGSYTLQAMSPSQPAVAAVTSAGFVISAAAPDHLTFTQQPTDTSAGQAINAGTAPAGVRVGLFDAFNNPVPQDSGDAVTLAVGSGPTNSLLGTLTQAASGGVAVFPDLALDAVGSYTLQAASTTRPTLAVVTSASFTISAAAPDHLAFVQQPTDTTAGQAIDGGGVPAGLLVGLFDRFNNPEAGDSGDTVTVAIHSGPSTSLLGTTTQTAGGGVAVFGDLAIDPAGSYTLQATSSTQPGLAAVISSSFVITPAAPDHLTFTQQPTDTVAGQAINAETAPAGVQVSLYDAFNNLETADSSDAVTLAVGSGPSVSLLGTLTEIASGGVATFPDLALDTAGGYTLLARNATRPIMAAIVSTTFVVSPAAPDHLAFGQQPTDTKAGATISPAVTVEVLDRFNNRTTTTAGVTLALEGAPGGASLGGTLTQATGGGVATFNDLSIALAGTGYTLTAVSPELGPVTSAAFTIFPSASSASQPGLAVITSPGFAVAGLPALSVQLGPIVKLRVFRHHHRVPGRYFEEVSLSNSSNQPIAGPFALVLEDLSARPTVRHHHVVMRSTHIRLLDANGFAQDLPGPGSPYLFDLFHAQQVDSAQGTMFMLSFSDPLKRPILYTPLLMEGQLP